MPYPLGASPYQAPPCPRPHPGVKPPPVTPLHAPCACAHPPSPPHTHTYIPPAGYGMPRRGQARPVSIQGADQGGAGLLLAARPPASAHHISHG